MSVLSCLGPGALRLRERALCRAGRACEVMSPRALWFFWVETGEYACDHMACRAVVASEDAAFALATQ